MIGGVFMPLTTWLGLSVYHRAMQDFPAGVVAVMVLCVTGKAAHRYFETRQEVARIEKDKPLPPAPEGGQQIGTVVQVEAQQ